jgi:trigger factor
MGLSLWGDPRIQDDTLAVIAPRAILAYGLQLCVVRKRCKFLFRESHLNAMKVKVEEVSSIEKRLAIEVDTALIESELGQAYAALSRQVKIPGFRPGKVPRRILEQKFKGDVERDVIQRLQLKATAEAVQSHKVPMLGEPQFIPGAFVSTAPYSFVARVEVKPDVNAQDWKGIVLKKQDSSVDEKAIDEQLAKMQASRTELSAVEGRDVVNEDDVAVIDFDATLDGQPFQGSVGRSVSVEVNAGELVDAHLPALKGAKVGVETSFEYTFPSTYRAEELQGKTAQFKATVKEIKSKSVPALDDAFAKSLGMDSISTLRARVQADLTKSEKNKQNNEEREAVFNALIAKNSFECPNALIEHGIDMMLEAALGSMYQSGIDPRTLSMDWGSLRNELRPRAEREARGQLILESVAKQQKIEVSDAQLEQELPIIAAEVQAPLTQIQQRFADPRSRETLRYRVIEDKAMELVKSHAKYE